MTKKLNRLIGVSLVLPALMAIAQAQYVPDNVPTGLNASINQSQQIYVTWGPPATTTNLSGYYLYRTGGLIADTAVTYYADVPPPGVYFYTVAAHNAQGIASPQTSPTPLITYIIDRTVPSAPTNLSATPTSSSTLLSWGASTDNIAVIGYYIYRNGLRVSTPSAITGTTYTDIGLSSNTQYSYFVVAYDAAGNTSAVPPLVTVTTIYDITPPSVPAGLSAVTVSQTEIDLTWKPSTDNIQVGGYNVYRDGVQIGTNASTSYADNTLSPQTTHEYSVAAYDSTGNVSAQSAAAKGTTLAHDDYAPSIPTNITAIPFSSSQVNLAWQPSSDNIAVTGYYIYQDGTQIGNTASTTYMVSGLATSTTYQFYVMAYDAAGNVSGPIYKAAKTLSLTAPPVAAPPPANGASPSPAAVVSPSGLPPAAGIVVFARAISFGMRNGDVKNLQLFLVRQGYLASTNATGYFGGLTQKALQKFQCDQNIVCSGSPASTGWGSVGAKTRKALNALWSL